MSWIRDIVSPKSRRWEELYRRRHQHDRVVRSTHGVNCTGSCSWNVHVKEGIVAWETQARDYPHLDGRPALRAARLRARGVLLLVPLQPAAGEVPVRPRRARRRLARREGARTPIRSTPGPRIVADPEARAALAARARQGRASAATTWDEALEIVAASIVHTVKTRGPDRVIGFSPIPAMSMLSLRGGVALPPAPRRREPVASTTGTATSRTPRPRPGASRPTSRRRADWYHSKYVVAMGSNPDVTRTPSAHYLSEARHDGTKVVVLSPDFSTTSQARRLVDPRPRRAGRRVLDGGGPRHPARVPRGREGAGVHGVPLPLHRRAVPGPARRPRRRAGARAAPPGVGRWSAPPPSRTATFKYLVWDGRAGAPRMPLGSLGHRWQARKGEWNLADEGRARRRAHRARPHAARRSRRRPRGRLPRLRRRRARCAAACRSRWSRPRPGR